MARKLWLEFEGAVYQAKPKTSGFTFYLQKPVGLSVAPLPPDSAATLALVERRSPREDGRFQIQAQGNALTLRETGSTTRNRVADFMAMRLRYLPPYVKSSNKAKALLRPETHPASRKLYCVR
jgi:hypothetical protein